MKRRLIIRPRAQRDLRNAYDWYEQQRKGLGAHFILCVDAAMESIQEDPYLCAVMHKNIRRKLLRRFPYAVFYTIHDDLIVVLAVLHCRRDPAVWMNRAETER